MTTNKAALRHRADGGVGYTKELMTEAAYDRPVVSACTCMCGHTHY